MSSYAEDYKNGTNGELRFIDIVKKHFDVELKQTGRYVFYDFQHNNCLIELKRRNNKRKRYRTTLITYDKVLRFDAYNEKHNNELTFLMVFHYNDGVYFFKHTKGYKYNVKPYCRKRRKGIIDKEKPHIFLNVNKLQPLEDLGVFFKVPAKPKGLRVVYNT